MYVRAPQNAPYIEHQYLSQKFWGDHVPQTLLEARPHTALIGGWGGNEFEEGPGKPIPCVGAEGFAITLYTVVGNKDNNNNVDTRGALGAEPPPLQIFRLYIIHYI